jgi:hypothetical protein
MFPITVEENTVLTLGGGQITFVLHFVRVVRAGVGRSPNNYRTENARKMPVNGTVKDNNVTRTSSPSDRIAMRSSSARPVF